MQSKEAMARGVLTYHDDVRVRKGRRYAICVKRIFPSTMPTAVNHEVEKARVVLIVVRIHLRSLEYIRDVCFGVHVTGLEPLLVCFGAHRQYENVSWSKVRFL